MEARGGQQCIPAVASRAGGLEGLCLAQQRGWRSEGAAALLGGRWKGRGRTGVEWKLAPHYLQLLVHSLMIKYWRSICSERVRTYVWAFESGSTCVQTNIMCLPYMNFFPICFKETLIKQCCCFVCNKKKKGFCCSGRGNRLTQGWNAG